MCLCVYSVAILCMWWGTAEHGGTVQFMYSAADSTTGWTEGEVVTELVAFTDLTFKKHTEFNEMGCWWGALSCQLIAYGAAL
jgi:hypothetical protein